MAKHMTDDDFFKALDDIEEGLAKGGKKPMPPDPSPAHEAKESPEDEAVEHETGEEAQDEPEDELPEEDEDEAPPAKEAPPKFTKKSLVDDLLKSGDPIDDEEAKKAIEVSSFLKSMTAGISRHLDSLGETVRGETGSLKKGMVKMMGLVASQAERIEELEGLVKSFGAMPERRTLKAMTKAMPRERFNRSESVVEDMSKAEAADILMKAASEGRLNGDDVINFESAGVLTPAAKAILAANKN